MRFFSGVCLYSTFVLVFLLTSWAAMGQSTLREDQVLAVFYAPERSDATASLQIWDVYHAKHPEVHAVNLADYLPVESQLTPGTISYPDFITKIRNPLREFLQQSSLETHIRVILLLKDIPHRIQDWADVPNLGDNPQASDAALKAGTITFASVDSELTLLWQDLEGADEKGRRYASNFILNPYFEAFHSLDSASAIITEPLVFTSSTSEETPYRGASDQEGASLHESQIYLTCRLDGHTIEDVERLIDRASSLAYNHQNDQWIFDSSSRNYDEGAFKSTFDRFEQAWLRRTHDSSDSMIIGTVPGEFSNPDQVATQIHSGDIAFLASYGANHSLGNQGGWLSTFQGQLVPGAIFNTYESYNGRKFGGVMAYADHAQLSDWIRYGGTFGLAHVWEPFTLAVAHNDILLENFFFNGLTWVEAAWSAIEILSWQNLIIGDPLAVANLDHLPLVTLSGSIGGLEGDENSHAVQILLETPATETTSVALQVSGATYGTDFVTTPPMSIDDSGITRVLIPKGASATTLEIEVLADSEIENLELLALELRPSEDIDHDTFGNFYSYLAPQKVLIGIADSPFELWRYGQFGDAASSQGAADADPDNDDVPNLIEYALGRNPKRPEPRPTALAFRPEFTTNKKELVFVTPASFPTDLRLVIEASPSLLTNSWSTLTSKQGTGPWEGSAPINKSDQDEASEEIRINIQDSSNQYFRYRAEQLFPASETRF